MHQLAIALQNKGYHITGSDDEINDPAKSNLANSGLLPAAAGWFPEKLNSSIDAVVLGMHARESNPELLAALQLGIPVYSFPEYIYEVAKNKTRVVVAGSHGKTTVTAMIMHILQAAKMDFDYMVGSKVPGFEQSVKLSDAPVIILEGDEYPASVIEKKPKIFFYHPDITVLNGISWDHINVFPTYENYFSQFRQFITALVPGTTLYYNAEDAEVVRLVNESAVQTENIAYKVPVFSYDNGNPVLTLENTEPFRFPFFGRHNMLNMEAAVGVCIKLGISKEDCYQAMTSFTGAARRLEKIFENRDLLVYRDFAHAPSKLSATLTAVREAYPQHHLVACFELHTFSSLNENFLKEYAHTMDSADVAIVYYSHHALELKGLPELKKELVKDNFGRNDLFVMNKKENLVELIKEKSTNQDKRVFLLLMSSGSFDNTDWINVFNH